MSQCYPQFKKIIVDHRNDIVWYYLIARSASIVSDNQVKSWIESQMPVLHKWLDVSNIKWDGFVGSDRETLSDYAERRFDAIAIRLYSEEDSALFDLVWPVRETDRE